MSGVWIAEVDERAERQRWVVSDVEPSEQQQAWQRFDSLAQAALALIGPECGDPDAVGMAVWQRRVMERMRGRFLPASMVVEN